MESEPGHWEVRPPLSQPGGFGQLEVMQLVPPGVVDSMPRLLFACGANELDNDMHPAGQPGGMWIATGQGMLGPWDIANARRIDHPTIYAAHIVTDVDGSPAALGSIPGAVATSVATSSTLSRYEPLVVGSWSSAPAK